MGILNRAQNMLNFGASKPRVQALAPRPPLDPHLMSESGIRYVNPVQIYKLKLFTLHSSTHFVRT